ncbi:hypothetical protein FOZ63_009086, partial [Perkinsus olseni]
WFNGAPVEALKRGNVRIWIAEYFFEGYEVLWDGQFPSVWLYGVSSNWPDFLLSPVVAEHSGSITECEVNSMEHRDSVIAPFYYVAMALGFKMIPTGKMKSLRCRSNIHGDSVRVLSTGIRSSFATVDQLTPSEEEEMEDMVDYMEQWARAKWEGNNTGDAGGGRYVGLKWSLTFVLVF